MDWSLACFSAASTGLAQIIYNVVIRKDRNYMNWSAAELPDRKCLFMRIPAGKRAGIRRLTALRLDYTSFLRRAASPPTSPVASSARLEGSGTV